jgi:hypothetical protein
MYLDRTSKIIRELRIMLDEGKVPEELREEIKNIATKQLDSGELSIVRLYPRENIREVMIECMARINEK